MVKAKKMRDFLVVVVCCGTACTTRRASNEWTIDSSLTDFEVEDYSLSVTNADLDRFGFALSMVEIAMYGARADLYAASPAGNDYKDDAAHRWVLPSQPTEASTTEILQGVERVVEPEVVTVDPQPSRFVFFVKTAAAVVRAEPMVKAPAIRTLEAGASVLAGLQGDWARLADEGFVALADLSLKPVAKTRQRPAWNAFKAAPPEAATEFREH
jgi:hypothetical protein